MTLPELTGTTTWDNQGRLTGMTYPVTSGTAPTFANQFDSMGRLGTMTEDDGGGPRQVASATYGVAGQVTALTYDGFSETRS